MSDLLSLCFGFCYLTAVANIIISQGCLPNARGGFRGGGKIATYNYTVLEGGKVKYPYKEGCNLL